MIKRIIFILLTALVLSTAASAQENLSISGKDQVQSNTVNTEVNSANIHSDLQETAVTDIQLYPNPSRGQFSIDLSGLSGTVLCDIVNRMGQSVYTETFTEVESHPVQSCYHGALPKGYYFVVIHNDNTRYVKQLMIN